MNIKERLAKISFFDVKPDFSSLSSDEKRAMAYCVNASDVITDIYLDQVYSKNKEIYHALQRRSDTEGRDLLRYFLVHGSPWDSYHNEEPFIDSVGERPKFGSFYPDGLTKKEWNNWLDDHPESRDQFESNYTVIKRKNGKLFSVPYSEEYREDLSVAAGNLERAASLLHPGNLKSFLELRAKAFRTNDYFESDMVWVDTNGSPFEVTIGPYEVYFDGLLGLKAAFESVIALPDKDSTEVLSRFSPKVPEFDALLSQEFNFKPAGSAIPLEVISEVSRGGGVSFSPMFVAYCLPNDRRIHELKGSKKVFSRTMMEAKFSKLSGPVAERILPPKFLENHNFNNRLLFVLGHELAHGVGPNKVNIDGREIPFETALGDVHSSLEEAKADTLGVRLLDHFRNRGLIDDKTLEGIISTNFVHYISSFAHSLTEAHSAGSLIEYNWLKSAKAIAYDYRAKNYDLDIQKCAEALSNLSTEFLKLQVSGNYERAKAFMEQWSTVPSEIPEIVERLSDLPLGVSPVFDLSELR